MIVFYKGSYSLPLPIYPLDYCHLSNPTKGGKGQENVHCRSIDSDHELSIGRCIDLNYNNQPHYETTKQAIAFSCYTTSILMVSKMSAFPFS